jgi:hypothetical protein
LGPERIARNLHHRNEKEHLEKLLREDDVPQLLRSQKSPGMPNLVIRR